MSANDANRNQESPYSRWMDLFEQVLFTGRWVLAPIYLFLTLALIMYSISSVHQLIELGRHVLEAKEDDIMLGILSLVDISMVGNLVIMITVGGYSIFVRRLIVPDYRARPQWLDHIDSTSLKVKMGLSLVGVSSIQLLKDFVDPAKVSSDQLYKQILLHVVFVASAVAVAYIAKLSHSSKPAPHGYDPSAVAVAGDAHGHEGGHGQGAEPVAQAAPAGAVVAAAVSPGVHVLEHPAAPADAAHDGAGTAHPAH